jgi:hypothetical protein
LLGWVGCGEEMDELSPRMGRIHEIKKAIVIEELIERTGKNPEHQPQDKEKRGMLPGWPKFHVRA